MNFRGFTFLFLLSTLLVSAPLPASTIKVDTPADEYCGRTDETCSLREAIEAANENESVCGCPAGEAEPVVDTITLDAGQYVLSRTGGVGDTNAINDLDITSSLIVSGPNNGSAIISGQGVMRVFEIHSGAVTFSQLTIQSGLSLRDGGGILVRGGNFTLQRATLVSNSAQNGGGLYVMGEDTRVELENCTLYENTAYHSGGGIFVATGTVRVESSTIASNSSDNSADPRGWGAGIFRSGGEIVLHNTILAENHWTGGGESGRLECSGLIGSDGFNIVGMEDGCVFYSRGFAGPDQKGSLGNRLNPFGGNPLAMNGGPTQTIALPAGSIAIDRGDPDSFPAADQRLLSREGLPDVGAYEVVCGDGYVTGNEVCDDGNKSDTDDCLNTCVVASCGDGFVREGVENCDGEGCLNDCSDLSVVAGGGAGPGDGNGDGDGGGSGGGNGGGGAAPAGGGGCSLIIPKANSPR